MHPIFKTVLFLCNFLLNRPELLYDALKHIVNLLNEADNDITVELEEVDESPVVFIPDEV